MRAALTAIIVLALALGCVYEPVEIARFEAGEDTLVDATVGSSGVTWTEADLHGGAQLLASLGVLEVEVLATGEGVHRVVIELLPIEPPTLAAGFVASIDRVGGDPIVWGESSGSGEGGEGGEQFEPFGAGLRYEGELELGWLLSLRADEHAELQVRAQILAP